MREAARTEICVFDLDREAVEVVLAGPRLIEASNWRLDPLQRGSALVDGHVLDHAHLARTEHHPRDLDVELRLPPAEGGEPRPLLRLSGGRGTSQVPCWRAALLLRTLPPGAEAPVGGTLAAAAL